MAKSFTGMVSSAAADKTIIVTINRSKTHSLYRKQYTVSKRLMAHDEKNEAQVGDRVVIIETKPLSARKRFALKEIVEKAAIQHVEEETVVPKAKEQKPAADKAEKAEGKEKQ